MARDKITVDLMLATKQAEREIARINRKLGDMGKTMGKAFGGTGAGGDKVRALGSGLSKATVKADEFSKSMEASNARVIAFGASAGLIMGIDRALKAMVSSAIKVEKAMLDVNVVMNLSTKSLDKFGKGMFKVAKDTAQGFDSVAEAATELARQGLGMEKTLARTKDALILTRLTGMDAADAVKTLTAAVNSFNKEGVTSAQIINRMAKVDAAFAVSSEDLAKSISRVGASAVSAGVSMNELMAITTSVQQKTARGGAVIGNAFKTIFTRLQRKDVLQNLRNLGVAVSDFNGNALSGIQVLQNLAGQFNTLSKATQSSTAEQVAGVFQVNILKAALSDLSSANSNYARALGVASSATNEAYQRNEQLNQSLDALINRTLANLTSAGAGLGGALEPAIRNVLGTINNVIESFGKGGSMEGFGKTIGSGLMKGLGDFIGGPGLIVMTAVFGKIALSLGRFAKSAFMDILNINEATKQRAVLEEAVVAHIASEPKLLAQVRTGTLNVLNVEQDILATIRAANAERARIQTYAAPLTGALMSRGVKAGSRGATIPGGAGGFIPNFADAGSERAAAAAGGYRAGSIKMMNQPGAGAMMYNSAETVKKFPGMSQSAIMPPQGSPAGAGYKSAFGAAHGFDPYAAGGFVPNFRAPKTFDFAPTLNRNKGAKALGMEGEIARKQGKPAPVNLDVAVDISKLRDIGIITETGTTTTPIMFSQQALGPKGIPALRKMLPKKMFDGRDGKVLNSLMLRMSPLPTIPIFPVNQGDDTASKTVGEFPSLKRAFNKYAKDISRQLFPNSKARDFNMGALSKGTEGDIFEEGLRAAVSEQSLADRTEAFDYNGPKYAHEDLIKFMNKKGARLKPKSKIEAKIGTEAAISGNIPKKVVNDALGAGMKVGPNINSIVRAIVKKYEATAAGTIGILNTKGKKPGKALGHLPNFALNPLASSIGRELSAGVPASAIRVGNSPALRSAGNPGGMGVYNTIHEPGGLQQGISRARSQGVNPKGHGVPNFSTFVKPAPMPSGPSLSSGPMPAGAPGISTGPPVISPREKFGLPPLVNGADAASKGLSDAGKAAKESAKASSEATKQTRRMGAAMGGMMVQMAAGAAAANMEEGSVAQTATKGVGSMAGYAGMGFMMGGPWGAAAGGAIGAVGMGLEMVQKHSDAAQQSLEVLAAKLAETQKTGIQVSEALGKVGVALSGLETEQDPSKRQQAGREIIAQLREAAVKLPEGSDAKSKVEGMISGIGSGKNLPTIKSMEKLLEDAELENKKNIRSDAFAKMGAGVKSLAKEDGGFGFISQEISEGNYGRAYELAGGDLALNPALMLGRLMGTGLNAAGIKPDWMPEGIGESLNNRQQEARAARAAKSTPGFFKEFMGKGTLADDSISIGAALQSSPKAMAAIEEMRTATSGRYFKQNYESNMADFTKKDGGFEKGMSKALDAAGIEDDAKKALKDNLNTAEGRQAFMDYMLGRGVEDVGSGLFSTDVKGQKAGVSTGFTAQEVQDSAAAAEAVAKIKIKAPPKAAEIGVKATRDFVEGLRKGSVAAKNQLKETQLQIVQSAKLRKIQDGYDIALAKATRDTIGLADAKLAKNLAEAAINFKDASTIAKDTFDSQMAADMATFGKEFEKSAAKFDKGAWGDTGVAAAFDPVTRKPLAGGAFGMGGYGTMKDSQINLARDTFKGLGSKGVDALSDRILDVQKRERQNTGTLSVQDQIVKEFGPKVLEKLKVRTEELDQKMRELGIQHTNAKTIAEKQAEIDKKMLALSRELNTEKAKELRLTTVMLGKQKVAEAARRRSLGQIGGKEYYATEAQYLDDQIAQRGIRPSDFGKGMTTAFQKEMAYDPVDYFNDLKEGSTELASTMKSSFANAFQSIASGANSVQGAFANMAQSILNSISSMSSQMFTNMMFSKMGWQGSQGGLVPGYAAGGVVTGGSGYKDDVPTMMQGGEFVIKKSSAQKIGYGKLNAINGYAEGGPAKGGPSMGQMGLVAAGASALSGVIASATADKPAKPIPSQDYGFGRGKHGFFGGADPDAGQVDSVAGGRGRASVSLGKGFVYYRRDPETGQLVSERARPTEGRFEVSQRLSLLGRLGEDDPQTGRMFSKEQSMAKYQDYLATETQSRKDQIAAVKKQKKQRLIGAYMNAAMLIGGAKFFGGGTGGDVAMQGIGAGMDTLATPQTSVPRGLSSANLEPGNELNLGSLSVNYDSSQSWKQPGEALGGYIRNYANGGSASGTPAMVMGGEYIMSPETVRTYGSNFMHELNRGNTPSYANGGPVGGGSGGGSTLVGGNTTNNVRINVNVDKSGKVEASAESGNGDSKEGDREEIENNKELGALLQTVVVQELVKQQRPGGLLNSSTTGT